MNPYESDELLHQYLLFHYASAEEQFPYEFGGADALNFPKRCAWEGPDFARLPLHAQHPEVDSRQTQQVLRHPQQASQTLYQSRAGQLGSGLRALDLGCAVGCSSYELARHFEEVIGIDYSQAFIDAANRMKADGRHSAIRLDEGSATTRLEVTVDGQIDRNRVTFEQGDAQYLRRDIGQFDLVMACNLICRLPEPMRLLKRLPGLLKPGGQLFITTPFTWLEEYTPAQNWLGDGAQDSFSGLRSALEPDFTLDARWDMPFLIREHARKFQYSIAQASRWVKSRAVDGKTLKGSNRGEDGKVLQLLSAVTHRLRTSAN